MTSEEEFDLRQIATRLQDLLGCEVYPLPKQRAIVIDGLNIAFPNGDECCVSDLDVRLSCAPKDNLKLVAVNQPATIEILKGHAPEIQQLMRSIIDVLSANIAKLQRKSARSANSAKG